MAVGRRLFPSLRPSLGTAWAGVGATQVSSGKLACHLILAGVDRDTDLDRLLEEDDTPPLYFGCTRTSCQALRYLNGL